MLIYDIEIRNAIPDRGGQLAPDVQYCQGWEDYAGMGVAVVGCYDYKSERVRVFCQDNLPHLFSLLSDQECVVGFNNQRFDDRIIEALGYRIPREASYDIYQEVRHGLGLAPHERRGGYTLDDLSRANFRASKSSGGAFAPVRWQRGEIGSVIDYCLHDLHLTKRLLDRIIRAGRLIDPNNPQRTIPIRKPGAQEYATSQS
jgi:hypothetical protein